MGIEEKIVYNAIKVDLHIHSVFSKTKDDISLVGENTIENTEVLIEKLKSNKIDMFSITDHDYFSYELYAKLKTYEKNGDFKKILPGIEFSVGYENENNEVKQVHVICIFDDANEEKIKNIKKCIPIDEIKKRNSKNEEEIIEKIKYDGEGKYFTEDKFISILNKIDLNVIMIAHQKNTNPAKNDLKILGENKFNEFLDSEYFEALEFRSMKRFASHKLFSINKNKNYDIVRFITGSDCHMWSIYPKHDPSEQDDNNFSFTYLKCLPTFKGLAMSLTDSTRIRLQDSFFSVDSQKINEIKMSIKGKKYNIPMSKGLNVIIGDNSIGKSLLLHTLTDNIKLLDSKKKEGYKKFIENESIVLETKIPENILYEFDYQGSVRDKFEESNLENNQEFLKTKFPLEPDKTEYVDYILTAFETLYQLIENKFNLDTYKKKISTLRLTDENTKSLNLKITRIKNNKSKINSLTDLNNKMIKLIDSINKIIQSEELESQDSLVLLNFISEIKKMKEKYYSKLHLHQRKYNLIEAINSGINEANENISKYKTDLEKIIENIENDGNELVENIAEALYYQKKVRKYEFDIPEKEIKSEISYYGKYRFVKRFKISASVSSINNEYLQSILTRCILKGKEINTTSITENELMDIIKKQNDIGNNGKSSIELLKEMVLYHINKDFEVETVILDSEADVSSKLSTGLNSTIYFDIISNDNTQGIYLIDQPEDDVSQVSIRKYLIDDFKKMSEKRQILMITHNPQFVVNLDVDNIICISRTEDGIIKIDSGALEYEDSITNILKLIANNLDGGVESIRKRWKRYEKDN